MAKRVFLAQNWTPGTVADNAALANNTYMALKGGSATQTIDVLEVEISGLAGASNPAPMSLARSITLGVTPTALANPNADGPMHPATAALAATATPYVAAATGPLRSNAVGDAKLNDETVLAGDSGFQGRCRAAMIEQAIAVGFESSTNADHVVRLEFAIEALVNPETAKLKVANATATDASVIADATVLGTVPLTGANVAAQALLVTDAHIRSSVTGSW